VAGSEQFEPVDARHHDVGQHEVRRFGPRLLERLLPVHRRRHGVLVGQQSADVVAHVGVVIGDENAGPVARDGPLVQRLVRDQPTIGLREVAHAVLLDRRKLVHALVDDLLGRQVFGADGDPHRERAALPRHADDVDGAAVHRGELGDQRQADARPLVAAQLRAHHPVEALEETGPLVGRDTDAGVLHRQLDAVGVRPQPDGHPAGEGRLECVGEEVEDDLGPHLAVDVSPARRTAVSNMAASSAV
jgi:hypothetical protein